MLKKCLLGQIRIQDQSADISRWTNLQTMSKDATNALGSGK